MSRSPRQWWRRTTRLSYLSSFERRLNRTLWAITWIALLFSVAQHVVLAKVPEKFAGGAAIGDLLYDLSIAYVGAFIFYLLVVRLPLWRDRRNYYRHLAPLIERSVQQGRSVMSSMHRAAGFDPRRENSWENVQETCSKVGPDTKTEYAAAIWGTPVPMIQVMNTHKERARAANREILELASYVSSDVINLITLIDNSNYFASLELTYPAYQIGKLGNQDLSVFSREIFDYLLICDRLDAYRIEYVGDPIPAPDYLISGTDRPSDEVPLSR